MFKIIIIVRLLILINFSSKFYKLSLNISIAYFAILNLTKL